MKKEDVLQALLNTVQNDIKHKDYKRVCDLAKDYHIYITGENIKSKLRRFNPREDKEMFEQRERLTIAITPAIAASITRPFNKVLGTPPVTKKVIANSKTNELAVKEIQERINLFYGSDNDNGGLDYWFEQRFGHLSFLDPNAWVVVEFDPFDNVTTKPMPRPFEVSCKEAINFSIKNNKVEWLIVENDIDIATKQVTELAAKSPMQKQATTVHVQPIGQKAIKGKKYTIYADNDAFTLTQITEDGKGNYLANAKEEIREIEGKGTFVLAHFETKTNHCPAIRIGYVSDVVTNNRTFVNPFHSAVCYLEKSIQTVSEFDISNRLHVFPKKIIRVTQSCKGEEGLQCFKGVTIDGTRCKVCNGTGKPIHTSGQDVVEVEMPQNGKEDYVPLNDFIHYVEAPIELLKFQKELVDAFEIKCHQSVFNSTALIRKTNGGEQINPTATETNKDMDSVYDTLNPFGGKVSNVWQFIVKTIATLTDNDKKVTILHRFHSNLRLKTREDLYLEREILGRSGSPSFVVDSVDDELAQEVYADDANALHQYRIKKEHFPFIGKSKDEISMLMLSSTTLKRTKILYTYYDTIFLDLYKKSQAVSKDFYMLNFAERQLAINAMVDEIIVQLDGEMKTAFKLESSFSNNNNADNNVNNG